MTNFINDDPVNNITYMNYLNALSNGDTEIVGTNGTSNNIVNFLTTRWGTGKVVIAGGLNNTGYYCFPLSANESKTDKTPTASNFRFYFTTPLSYTNSSGYTGQLNSSVNGQTILSSILVSSWNLYNVPVYQYGICTNNQFNYCLFLANGSAFTTTTNTFISMGWLSDAVFTDARSLYQLVIQNNAVKVSRRCSAIETTVQQNFLTSGLAQYPITCLNSGLTPSDAELWCTDLWLRDDPSGYAIGRVPHVLMTNNSVLNLGEVVYIDSVIDGVTDQKIWLVAAIYGTRRLLMRVFTEGISPA